MPVPRAVVLLLSLALTGACTDHEDPKGGAGGTPTTGPTATTSGDPAPSESPTSGTGAGCGQVADATLTAGLGSSPQRTDLGTRASYLCRAEGPGATVVWTVDPARGATLEEVVADISSSSGVDVRRIRIAGGTPAELRTAQAPYGFASLYSVVDGVVIHVSAQGMGGEDEPGTEVLTSIARDIAEVYGAPGAVPEGWG